jgi:hypothetical protein
MFLDNILLVKALNFSFMFILNICHSETPRLTEASAIRKDTRIYLLFAPHQTWDSESSMKHHKPQTIHHPSSRIQADVE